MAKSGKNFIKPGSLATQKKTKYERIRDRRINEIRTRLEASGIMHTIASLRGSSLPNCTKAKGRGTGNEVDDDDYRLPSDEDDGDNESFDSFEHEVLEMPPGGLGRSQVEPQQESTTVRERVTRSTPHPMVDNQPSPPPAVELQSEAVASSNAVAPKRRGLTRGLEIPVLIEKNGGKLLVPIPQEHRAPVGIYASKLASKIGVEVRERVHDLSVKSWKAVDEGIKAPLFQRLKDQFHFEGDPIDVHKAIATRCGRRLSDHTHKLYKKFKSLKESKGEGYVRSHPPPKISMEQWTSLIEKKWTNKDWMEKMKQIEAEHNQAGATPLTQEELSIAALKKRPGYVKGLGLRPSSSIRTTCESATTIEYVTRLEKKLEERDETIEKLLEENKQQQVLNASIMEFLIEKGYTRHLGSGGLSSND
ncbi:hypothetical protein Vadar_005681 [Vaccinium darrowii]|uniref:Uncharacterized protein n=1 Tax=Vaccinium darrowii TaxID=229202 RepID=A0ACB7Y5Q3_9ERIC|nr:hypothetical protein Vadar_005681 [Vaccinium darrowii]